MLIDTHCHLSDPAFAADRDDVVSRARHAGVERMLVIESRLAGVRDTVGWASRHPEIGVATACHPHDAASWTPALAAEIGEAWREPAIRAAGEMGLDYHYDHAPRPVQRDVFAEQLALAADAALPVVIHARDADEDTVAILSNHPGLTVVLHSFSSGPALRDAGLRLGWYFSFSGMVTFKSWAQADTVRSVAPDRLLVETDAPYLAPVPHRGERNEPAFVADVTKKIAELRGTTFDAIAEQTTANAMRLFWPHDPSS